MEYVIEILEQQINSDTADLIWAINKEDNDIIERQKERLRQLQNVMDLIRIK